MEKVKELRALSFRSLNVMSSIIDDKSEPIGVLCVCWYILLSKVKNVDDNTKRNVKINSYSLILVCSLMCFHLFTTSSNTRSMETLMNKDTTSNEHRT